MVPSQLSTAYTTMAHHLYAMKQRVDAILSAYAEERDGQYASRIKTIDSILDKVVLGNYEQLLDIEDLFAATIILPSAPIGETLTSFTEYLSGHFIKCETRSNRTRKPSEFIYDDLHFILRFKDSAHLLNKALLSFSFELQVKSYLQHAWAKATHNSIYKAPIESWRASRVAAQTRAAVEMVEAALAIGENLLPDEADQRYKPIDDRVTVLGLLLEWWKGEFPANRRRLGIFTLNSLKLAGLSIVDFQHVLESPRAKEIRNVKSVSLQQAILVLLLEKSLDSIVRNAQEKGDQYLLITREMEDLSSRCRDVPKSIRFSLATDD